MKSLFYLLLLLSFSAFAKVESYKCLTHGKLPRAFEIEFSNCTLTEKASFDICEVDEGKVVIPLNPLKSLLLTESGETIELSCSEFNDNTPEPENSPAPTTMQRSERAEPGHGGSNIRGRQ